MGMGGSGRHRSDHILPCITLRPANTLALLRTWPRVSSLRLDILRRSLRCIPAQSVAGITLMTRHLTWYLSCFLRTYLALLNAVLVPKVEELEMRMHIPHHYLSRGDIRNSRGGSKRASGGSRAVGGAK